jgi:Family of unknown function (DUF5701)
LRPRVQRPRTGRAPDRARCRPHGGAARRSATKPSRQLGCAAGRAPRSHATVEVGAAVAGERQVGVRRDGHGRCRRVRADPVGQAPGCSALFASRPRPRGRDGQLEPRRGVAGHHRSRPYAADPERGCALAVAAAGCACPRALLHDDRVAPPHAAGSLDARTPAVWISNGTGRDGPANRDAPKVGWCWAGNRHTWLGFASASGRFTVDR